MIEYPPGNARDSVDRDLIPASGRCPGGGYGDPIQCSCLETPMTEDPGGLQSMGSQSQKRLSTHARTGFFLDSSEY